MLAARKLLPAIGPVMSSKLFGAFVISFGKRNGLMPVPKIENLSVNHPSNVLIESGELLVKPVSVCDRGKARMSVKVVDEETGEEKHGKACQPGS